MSKLKMQNLAWIFMLFLVLSCQKSDEGSKPDLSVLGIESISFNGTSFTANKYGMVNDNGLSEKFIALVGMTDAGALATYKYSMKFESLSPNIMVKSKYSDISVLITEITELTKEYQKVFKVTVTRPGYKERIEYTFHFFIEVN